LERPQNNRGISRPERNHSQSGTIGQVGTIGRYFDFRIAIKQITANTLASRRMDVKFKFRFDKSFGPALASSAEGLMK
jgi:hypothetical protein